MSTDSLNTPTAEFPTTEQQARLPAWLLSLVVHLAVLLALALSVRGTARSLPIEADRAVSVVLAERNAQGPTTYFQEPAERSAAEQPAAAAKGQSSDDLLPDSAALAAASSTLPTAPAGLPLDGPLSSDLLSSPRAVAPGRPVILPGLGDEEILRHDSVRNRPPGPAGEPVRLNVFGAAAQGRSFAFLIDRSQSMGGQGLGAIEAAEQELVRELAVLEPVHRFQIIAYNQKPLLLADEGPLSGTAENKQRAAKFLAGIVAFGGTQHQAALTAALRHSPDAVFLLTDAGEPLPSWPEVRALLQRAGKTTIHCVQFGRGPLLERDGFMQRLAGLSGGSFSYVDMNQR